MLEMDKISAGYGKHQVLQAVCATFGAGSLTSLIGVNGSGKSTLLKALLGILPLDQGQIRIDGQALTQLSRNQIARRIAYLPQGRATPDMTVEQLVLHGRFPHLSYPRRYSRQDRQIAAQAMEQLQLTDLARKPLHTLSGGMRQNAYIAMALAQDTDYILLDEPTTYLDIAHQLELMRTLRRLADGGKGIVTVMHDLPMALTFSDRVLLLDRGQVAGWDTPEELCRKGLVDRIFGVGVQRSEDGKSYRYQY